MQDDEEERQREGRAARNVLLVALPLFLAIAITLTTRIFLHAGGPSAEDIAAQNAARSLIGPELRRVRAEHDRETSHEAKAAARKLAQEHLFPAGENTVTALTVAPLKRGRYRVRGRVTFREGTKESAPRHFEADLLHGPADDKWRLVDTEFLP